MNCVANGRILREGPFKRIWIQPAAGDAGGAIGAAAVAWYEYQGALRTVNGHDTMKGSYLGPHYDCDEVRRQLDAAGAKYIEFEDSELMPRLAGILATENVVGWMQGRIEFGPRALGGRSIIGDPRSAKMQTVMNLKIKYRESFRPFAPSVLAERVGDYFDLSSESPYMLIVAPVRENLRIPLTAEQQSLFGIEKLKLKRSELPAITHVDYSARVQTVNPKTNPRFYALLKAFETQTGCGVLVNTSFNVRGEPIVCTPTDAYRCFMRTEMDYLVVENFLLGQKGPACARAGRVLENRIRTGLIAMDKYEIKELDETGAAEIRPDHGGGRGCPVRSVLPLDSGATYSVLAVGDHRGSGFVEPDGTFNFTDRLSRLDEIQPFDKQGYDPVNHGNRVLARGDANGAYTPTGRQGFHGAAFRTVRHLSHSEP